MRDILRSLRIERLCNAAAKREHLGTQSEAWNGMARIIYEAKNTTLAISGLQDYQKGI